MGSVVTGVSLNTIGCSNQQQATVETQTLHKVSGILFCLRVKEQQLNHSSEEFIITSQTLR